MGCQCFTAVMGKGKKRGRKGISMCCSAGGVRHPRQVLQGWGGGMWAGRAMRGQ